MFISKQNYWKRTPSIITYTWYYIMFVVLGKNANFEKQKRTNIRKKTQKEELLKKYIYWKVFAKMSSKQARC